MVHLLSAKISNLYSYDRIDTLPDEKNESISFSNINVIVGPNDSGKSNIFRAIKLLIDNLKSSSAIANSDVFSNEAAPTLEAEFMLSDREAEILLDFFGVYTIPHPVYQTIVYRFKNRKTLLNSIKQLSIKIRWQPTNYDSLYPNLTFYFKEIDVKIHTNNPAVQAIASKESPFKNLYPTEKFSEFLDNLVSSDESERQSAVSMWDAKDYAFPIDPINLNNVGNPAKDRAHIESLFSFAGLTDRNASFSFPYLLGAILSRTFLFSAGGTIFYRKKSLIEQAQNVERTLEQEMRDYVRNPAPLDPDGWNLAEYLFNLKNSADSQERKRFRFIQETFTKLFPRLSFDAIYQTPKMVYQPLNVDRDFRYPSIILCDSRNSKQFSLDKVGAGISESLFLLTASLGVSDSVVLLDEPAVNLHPAQMKTLLQMLCNAPNQLLIITHSPLLLRNLLFDKGATVLYVRRPDGKSLVRTLDPKQMWSDVQLYKSSYLIDPRIFFAQHILLCEGESDKYFFEATAEAFDLNPDTYEDIIIDAGSKDSLPRYKRILELLAIPYVVVADSDKNDVETLQERAESYGSEKDYKVIDSREFANGLTTKVFFFDGNVERFMQTQDGTLYSEVKTQLAENGLSSCKPAFMHEFVKQSIKKNPQYLETTIKPLLEYTFHVSERKL